MKIRVEGAKKRFVFRLSKLGGGIPNDLFIDADGTIFHKVQHERATVTPMVRADWLALAMAHVDWKTDIRP